MGLGRINREGEFHSHPAGQNWHRARLFCWRCDAFAYRQTPPLIDGVYTFHSAFWSWCTTTDTRPSLRPVIRREFTALGPISDSLARLFCLIRSSYHTRRRHQLPFPPYYTYITVGDSYFLSRYFSNVLSFFFYLFSFYYYIFESDSAVQADHSIRHMGASIYLASIQSQSPMEQTTADSQRRTVSAQWCCCCRHCTQRKTRKE